MTRIDNAALLALLRTQLQTVRHVDTAQRPGRAAAGVGRGAVPADGANSVALPLAGAGHEAAARSVMVQRVGRLAVDDPLRRRKAFRMFLDNVLIGEFGMALVSGHDFEAFVEQVLLRMESFPELALSMEEAGELLLAEAHRKEPPPAAG